MLWAGGGIRFSCASQQVSEELLTPKNAKGAKEKLKWFLRGQGGAGWLGSGVS